jgi:hypothetical protein
MIFLHYGEQDIVSIEEIDELINVFCENIEEDPYERKLICNNDLLKKLVKK